MVTSRSKSIIISVAINVWTRFFVIIISVIVLIAVFNARVVAIVISVLILMSTIDVVIASVSVNREFIDKSMFDVRIISVISIVIMAFIEVCWRILNKLLMVKKFGFNVEIIAISISRAISDFCFISYVFVK